MCILLLASCRLQFSQNITNTLGTNGTFTVKDGAANYLTLSQSTGYLSLNRSLVLPLTTGSTTGVIFKGSNRFLHNYQPTGTFGGNLFLGQLSGNFTMSGSGTQASYNTGFGDFTLTGLTTGYQNSAFGSFALDLNSIGHDNSAFGMYALFSNTTGYRNSAFGSQALFSNTDGYGNSAFGFQSLYSGSSCLYNTAFGFQSLYTNNENGNSSFGYQTLFFNTGATNSAFGERTMYNNTSGDNNSAFGVVALNSNTTGSNNSAFGGSSLVNCTGSNNTAIGYLSGSSLTSGINNIMVGYSSNVPSSVGSNQVRIGNTSVTYAGIQVAWTITSDRKWKDNILSSPLGLNFINRLNPVSYTRKNVESKKTEYGLIAQEVEEVLKLEGAENTAMITVTDEGNYELRYNDLIAPMIKAIQELKSENDKLKNEVDELRSANEKILVLEKKLNELMTAKEIKSVEK